LETAVLIADLPFDPLEEHPDRFAFLERGYALGDRGIFHGRAPQGERGFESR
jgi:hypothetical protein